MDISGRGRLTGQRVVSAEPEPARAVGTSGGRRTYRLGFAAGGFTVRVAPNDG